MASEHQNLAADADIMRSVLPYQWASSERYQVVREYGSIGFAFKPTGSGLKYIAGTTLCFGVLCPAFFSGFWVLAARTHAGMIGGVGGMTCLLGSVACWMAWKSDVRRPKAGPLWWFDPATGMFHGSRQKIAFHRDQLRAIQMLKFDRGECTLVQANFVVNQPDGQLSKRHVIRTVGDCGLDDDQVVLREFLRETGCAEVPVLKHDEPIGDDLGYALVNWSRGKKN